MQDIIASPKWHEMVSLIRKGTVLILGAPDTGKTTLAKFLIERWCEQGWRVALIDGDIGQSTLGPPGTVGLALFDSPPSDWERIQPLSLRFIGSITPVGYMLPLLVGLKRLVEEAVKYKARIILVDTTGLIHGKGGRELKFNKVELLRPSYLLALERSDELEHILRPLERIREMEIHRLPVSEKARNRSREQRKAYRRRKLQRYFQNAQVREIPLRVIAFQGSWLGSGEKILSGDLSFLSDALKTEVIHAERGPEGKLLVKTPLEDTSKVKVVQFGSVKY